ncbi:helix-turn-helix domain-containing protein [Muricoccus vinaceus]|uniref:Helix-turn-helix domain-containing protein n=1 Tax=Muricoccus vinaceus TaxID=424704 RepID=A0ABV6IU64_9PROT
MSEFPAEGPQGRKAGFSKSSRLVLSQRTRAVELGALRTILTIQAFDILVLLARHAPEAVDKATIAREIGLFSRVELDGAVRVRVSMLRVQLRAIGFPEVILSGPGRAYRLSEWITPEVVEGSENPDLPSSGIRAACTTSHRKGRGPLRRGTADVSRGAGRDAQEDHLLGDPERPPSGIVLTQFGLLDLKNRALDFGSGRLNFATFRDFEFVAAVMRASSAEVEEALLLELCNYAPGRFGPQVLRRTSRRLNALLEKVDAPFRIEPCAKPYGSAYRGVAVPTDGAEN